MPTALHHYTIAEVEATEKGTRPLTWPFNAKLGRFTNFVNLMDMCGVSVPSGVLECEELSPDDADGALRGLVGVGCLFLRRGELFALLLGGTFRGFESRRAIL